MTSRATVDNNRVERGIVMNRREFMKGVGVVAGGLSMGFGGAVGALGPGAVGRFAERPSDLFRAGQMVGVSPDGQAYVMCEDLLHYGFITVKEARRRLSQPIRDLEAVKAMFERLAEYDVAGAEETRVRRLVEEGKLVEAQREILKQVSAIG